MTVVLEGLKGCLRGTCRQVESGSCLGKGSEEGVGPKQWEGPPVCWWPDVRWRDLRCQAEELGHCARAQGLSLLPTPPFLSLRSQDKSVAEEARGACVWLPPVCAVQLAHCPEHPGEGGRRRSVVGVPEVL